MLDIELAVPADTGRWGKDGSPAFVSYNNIWHFTLYLIRKLLYTIWYPTSVVDLLSIISESSWQTCSTQ
jgi:hypothetical protein